MAEQITPAEQAMRNNGYDPCNDNGYYAFNIKIMKQAIQDYCASDSKGTFMDTFFEDKSV
jgi:hypothetical protein